MSPSDIQVFVRWKDQTIFAGEDVECTITFRNVADGLSVAESSEKTGAITNGLPPPTGHQRRHSRGVNANLSRHGGRGGAVKSPHSLLFNQQPSSRRSYPASPRKSPFIGEQRSGFLPHSHRASSSLSSPVGLNASNGFPSLPSTPRSRQSQAQGSGHQHKRSVSILSIDSDSGLNGDRTPTSPHFSRSRPGRGHGRSASLQVFPRHDDAGFSHGGGGRSNARISQPSESVVLSTQDPLGVDSHQPAAPTPARNGTSPAVDTNELLQAPPKRPKPPPVDFKFPATSPERQSTKYPLERSPAMGPVDENSATGRAVSATAAATTATAAALNSAGNRPRLTRIVSTSSVNGSNRSSGEFFSISDNSSETLASEYTNYSSAAAARPSNMARHVRHYSSASPATVDADGQTLLMGYAQISASFTVDGSLINQSAFEEVKRKGVVGSIGQGNALSPSTSAARMAANIVPEKARKSGGFWGTLGFSAIEESLSGLLPARSDLEGLRDMRGVASSRSIPLLSTPQSLLFVDLRLSPGEERSYDFSFTLPRGLPASHKGKAIKILYNLVIGTQRPSNANSPQRVNRINIPFRVFSGVNGNGDILGHDLMSPYVLLRDQARVGPSTQLSSESFSRTSSKQQKNTGGISWTSAQEFLSYVDEILEPRTRGSSSLHSPSLLADGMPSPDVPAAKSEIEAEAEAGVGAGAGAGAGVDRNQINLPLSCKDAIDLAVLRSNQAVQSKRSPNRFEISRNGRRIAVVVLNRPAHRLGETVLATVEFAASAIPCYALRASLESSEKVAPTLSMRSSASIHRATRRIHASFYENTLFSSRVVFSPAIPVSATPTVITSGVNLEWELRFEFVTPRYYAAAARDEDRDEGGDLIPGGPSGVGLLEVISEDERGRLLSAVENLQCESFEIAIPLTVYGETVKEPALPEEIEGYSI